LFASHFICESFFARLPIAPAQNKRKRYEHHRDGEDDENAIERHWTSPSLTENSVSYLRRKHLAMDQT